MAKPSTSPGRPPGRKPNTTFGLALTVGVMLGPCSRDGHSAGPRPGAPATTASHAAPSTAPVASADAAVRRPPRNVLLVTIDCLRADMPWAGYPRPIAPRLTELAARSVLYTHAYALSSYTSMSLGGLLGGKLPGELRRDGYFFGVYGKENVLFPEVLQAAGVHTLAGHAHGYFHDAGFDQGFDRWEVVPNLKWSNTTDENVTSPELEAIAEKLLSDPRATSGRFFAWFHFLDPHDQYKSHPGIGPYGATARDLYDGEVTFTDGYVGKLLDFVAAQPWGGRTAIVVTADHGEAFGEHHQYVHGFELWENLVRVPLFFVVPGVKPRAIDAPTSAVDLAPTLLELLGVAADTPVDGGAVGAFEGKSLVPELEGREPEPRDVAIDLPETSDNDRRRAIVHGNLKLIAFGKNPYFQVFDLASDPGELHPLPRGEAFDAMVGRYRAFEKTLTDVPPTKCREGCLNGAYAKKDAGGSPP